ncbi:anti-sigma factor family protein [Rhizobium sp. SGZ-381]|uniref:anti-sigma factor family protein n=1 Tax=Rhizobium sp. SGZ-381 TaxID=3342800 RepID=UPI00366C9147
MKPVDPVQSADVEAYVDDQLDAGRRIEVEAYLSENPDIAARVMADLAIKGELRLALAEGHRHGRPETREAARRLQAALSRGRIVHSLQRLAATVALVAAGWGLSSHFGPFTVSEVVASVPPPAFVEEAIRAHGTSALRHTMHSQQEAPRFDPTEIRSATAIVMPDIPKDWQVEDVQIFPSAFGPSVEMALTDGDKTRLSLFAVRPGSFAVQQVSDVTQDAVKASYWQIGEVAYALVAHAENATNLRGEAERLAKSLY